MTKDEQIEKLLGALKNLLAVHDKLAEYRFGESKYHWIQTTTARNLIQQIEAEIAAEKQKEKDKENKMASPPSWVSSSMTGAFVTLSKGDYPEDFPGENGNYQCICSKCGKSFLGHKRRVTCKTCFVESPHITIIRAAKEIIRVLKLPDGGGVAYSVGNGWYYFEGTPVWNKINRFWDRKVGMKAGWLSSTALAPWPGPAEESWIDANTKEEI